MSMIVIAPKAMGETRVQQFNFLSQLAVGETLTSAVTSASVWSGVDSNPSAVLSGTPAVTTPTAYQKVTGGTEGTIYLLTCTGVTSQGNSPIIQTYLAIVSNPL